MRLEQYQQSLPRRTRVTPPMRTVRGVVYSRKLYKTWRNMFYRCYNPENISYPNYGALGIGICDRWQKSFACFAADMGEPPTRSHSIQRKDGKKNYCPENCCWATSKQQGTNRVRAFERRRITWGQVAHDLGICRGHISNALSGRVGSRETLLCIFQRVLELTMSGWTLSEHKRETILKASARTNRRGVKLEAA